MRVILDANVWLSYLPSPTSGSTIAEVVNLCLFSDLIELFVPVETIAEVERQLANNSYFAQRVTPNDWAELKSLLLSIATIVTSPSLMQRVGRDPKDEYLLATAQQYAIDYLVTGDKDLKTSEVQEIVAAVNPAEFLHLLLETLGRKSGSDSA